MKKLLMSLGVFSLVFSIDVSYAQTITPTSLPTTTTTIPLWSQSYLASQHLDPLPIEQQDANGAVSAVAAPRMLVSLPTHTNHMAILVISGGGYRHEELAKEGTPAAQWLVQQGFTVFNLIYRLPADNWQDHLVPLADGQRALRLIRQNAQRYHYHQIGVMGFSAGGHLAGMLAVSSKHNFYSPQDATDNLSPRPDFVALLYPIVSMVSYPHHSQSFKQLLGSHSTPDEQKSLSIEQLVNKETPPMFIAHAKDDPIAPVADSIVLDDKLKQSNIAQSLTLFDKGGHGWGLGKPNTPTMAWPALFERWLKQTIN